MTKPTAPSLKSIPHLHGLDHLRALAITLVFVFHYGHLFPHPQWVETIGAFGWTGVDLFFVLSGYLIASQLFAGVDAEKKVSLKTFYGKRFFRIIPAYLVVVAVYFFFPAVHEREALPALWKFLTFTQNLGLDIRTQGTFSHAWSLCIEEQFYLFLPLILALLLYLKILKKGFWILVGLFLFGLFIRYYVYQNIVLPHRDDDSFGVVWYNNLYYPTYSRLDGLLAGVGLAALCRYRPMLAQRLFKKGNVLIGCGLLVFAAAYFFCSEEMSLAASVVGFPMIAIGYGLWVASAVSPTSFLFKAKSCITATLASLSYAVYLVHKIVIHLTQRWLSRLGIDEESNWQFLACIITTLLAAFALNRIVEKPFLQLRKKITGYR